MAHTYRMGRPHFRRGSSRGAAQAADAPSTRPQGSARGAVSPVDAAHEEDMQLLRAWHSQLKSVPDLAGLGQRTSAWLEAHPDDGEALFYRYLLLVHDQGPKGRDAAVCLRRSSELGIRPRTGLLRVCARATEGRCRERGRR